MVTFSPRIDITPGSFTSQISHLGAVSSIPASGLRAEIRSEDSVRTRLPKPVSYSEGLKPGMLTELVIGPQDTDKLLFVAEQDIYLLYRSVSCEILGQGKFT